MSQLGIGLRTMRDTGTRGRNPPQIIRAAINTMGKERSRGEQAKLIEIADSRNAKGLNRDVAAPEILGKRPLRHPNELSLGRRLGSVYRNRISFFQGQLGQQLEQPSGNRIGGVGRDADGDALRPGSLV